MGEFKPYLAVFVMQLIYSGMTLLSKAVFNEGMNSCVFIFYRQLVGAIILVPLTLIIERKSAVPLSFVPFCKIFGLSFIGLTLTLNLSSFALVYTSATLGAAFVNCLPATTFLLAVILRMEKVNIRTKSGIAKIGSVLLCLGGVATLAFYKGPQLRTLHHLLPGYHHHHHNSQHHEEQFSTRKRWILGSLLLFLASITWSVWIVIQAKFLKSYPSKLHLTSLQCLSSAIQSFGVAIAFERDTEQWKLGWNMRLLAVVYTGTLVTGLVYCMQTWLIEKRGPVFTVIWNPLSFVIATTASILLLGEPLCLGSVAGGVMLVLSLYTVLWAKSKEGIAHQKSLPVQSRKECAGIKKEASDEEPHQPL